MSATSQTHAPSAESSIVAVFQAELDWVRGLCRLYSDGWRKELMRRKQAEAECLRLQLQQGKEATR